MSADTITLWLTVGASVLCWLIVPGGLYIWLALLANRNSPMSHQDTDSQSAISAGDFTSIHNGANK